MPNHFTFPYGQTTLGFQVPDDADCTILAPHKTPAVVDPLDAVRDAVNTVDWSIYRGLPSVGIAINDKTRPVPNHILLPPLLEKLESIGIAARNITFYIATGTHPAMMPDEYSAILPEEIIARYRVVSHNIEDLDNLVRLGSSKYNTLVTINRDYFQSNLKIVVGNIEPHQFAGFSGGAKTAVIGLAGWETINKNHLMMSAQGAGLGLYEGNPVRDDIEHLGKITNIHLALNVVMNSEKQIVRAFCGNPQRVMRMAIPIVREVYEMPVEKPFDVIIASPGGHPKDINMYQAQKALGHAVRVSRPGGAIIITAACPEGSGSGKYEAWVTNLTPEYRTPEGVIERFKADPFRIGPHKAFQIARDTVGRRVIWVTNLPDPKLLLLESAPTLEAAFADVWPHYGRRLALMPYANATIPALPRVESQDGI
jgi:lactate racemase